MKNIKIYALLAGVLFTTYSCNKDEISSESIFVDTPESAKSDFDNWILENLTKPYNITLDYYYKDNETDIEYNVTPPSTDKAIALAKLVKHAWMDPYIAIVGKEFLKESCFRQFVFVGSPEYTGQGKIKLGQAEGGIKVTLFRVNELDPDNIYINSDNFYASHYDTPLDLNYWYFHTMHHEFCHILTQKKEYTTEYRGISEGDYSGPDWNNVTDEEAAERGFVSGYSTKEYNEDFAEMYSTYVTSSEKAWNQILDKATKYLVDENGQPVYELDANGNPKVKSKTYMKDKNNLLVPETDANGNIVYATDKNGAPVYFTDAEGNKIPMYDEQVKGGIYYAETKNGIIPYFVYDNQLFSAQDTDPSFTPSVETLNGDTIYTKDGNTIQKYYRVPLFQYKYEYVQKTDETAKKKILSKLELVRAYFQNNWKIDIDELRAKILENTSMESLKTLNLKSAK